jgi:hypothetical protein
VDHGGTLRHGYVLPAGSYERIVASSTDGATGFVAPLGDAAPHKSSIQRYKPQNAAIIPDVNGTTENFGDNHAEHTPSQAGRALPGSNGRTATIESGADQDSGYATVTAGSPSGVARGNESPGGAIARRQRPQSLTDTARIGRAARLRDLLASIAEWERASGPDRVWWRRDARHRLAEWRRLHAIPERAAFQRAVAAAQHKERAA